MRLKIGWILILPLLLVACNHRGTSENNNQLNEIKDSLEINPSGIEQDRATWAYDVMADTIVQVKNVDKDTLTVEKMINLVNSVYHPKVLIDFTRIGNDTLFIVIKESQYLTQQMGSSGAFEFMISTTFMLTDLSGIEYITYDFQEGDHASPGTYSRKYYYDWIKKNRKLNKY